MQTPNAPASGTTPVVAATPAPGTPEYDAAMVAKFDNVGVTPAPAVDAPKKPEGVPDKFWNADKGEVDHAAWAKSTAELEAALTKSKQQPKPQQPQQAPTVDPVKVHADKTAELRKSYTELKAKADAKPEEVTAAAQALADHLSTEPAKPVQNDEAADQAATSAGLNMEALRTEYAEKGALSDESYAAFEKVGITRDLVDGYIAGQQAIANSTREATFKLVGGEENYGKMIEWAKANLSPAERAAYDSAMDQSAEARSLAVSGLHQRYTAANGVQPELLGGGRTPASGGYRSKAEQTAAIRDPRYAKDPAYRADVMARIAASGDLM